MRESSSCRILVIDDEAALLRLMKTYLERLGYTVDAFEYGPQAWRQYQAHADQYSLVIADLTMPDIEIEPLLPRFVELNPAARVLVCSGRPFDTAALPRSIRAQYAFLQKPFAPKMLADAMAARVKVKIGPCAMV